MIFSADITIPANTTKAAPKTVLLGISKGVITKFMVRPRQGHAALAHLVIRYNEGQIAPSTEGMDLHGDADPIDWEDHIEVLRRPYELKLVGWNDDDTYPHTFTVFVVILQEAELQSSAIVRAISGLLRAVLPPRILGGRR